MPRAIVKLTNLEDSHSLTELNGESLSKNVNCSSALILDFLSCWIRMLITMLVALRISRDCLWFISSKLPLRISYWKIPGGYSRSVRAVIVNGSIERLRHTYEWLAWYCIYLSKVDLCLIFRLFTSLERSDRSQRSFIGRDFIGRDFIGRDFIGTPSCRYCSKAILLQSQRFGGSVWATAHLPLL